MPSSSGKPTVVVKLINKISSTPSASSSSHLYSVKAAIKRQISI